MPTFKYSQDITVEADQYIHGIHAPKGTRFCIGTHGHECSKGHDDAMIHNNDWVVYTDDGVVIMKPEEFEKTFVRLT